MATKTATTTKVAYLSGGAKDDALGAMSWSDVGSIATSGVSLDVMFNDPGSSKLFQLPVNGTGTNPTGTRAILSTDPVQTLVPSTAGAIAVNGGSVTLNGAGTAYTYKNAGFSMSQSVYDALAGYESVPVDTFYYVIQMANGALSQGKVDVKVFGVNDAVSITGGTTSATVTEDTATAVTGALNYTDVDLSDSHWATITGMTSTGPSALGLLSITSVAEAPGAASGAVNLSYTVNNAAAQYLAAGESVVETYTVKIGDRVDYSGSNVTQAVAITINGLNDPATIGSLTDSEVTEDESDPTLTAAGTITVSDPDHDQSSFQTTVTPAAAGYKGTLTLAANGAYAYTVPNASVQSMWGTESETETFTIKSLDGTSKDVSFKINGAWDDADIGGDLEGLVSEDGVLTAFGTATVTDPDHGQAVFGGHSSESGTYGTFDFDDITGGWTYTLNNGAAVVQNLTDHDTGNHAKVDSLSIWSLDLTAYESIQVAIEGADEAGVNLSVHHPVSFGTGNSNKNKVYLFDANDVLEYVPSLTPGTPHLVGGSTVIVFTMPANPSGHGNPGTVEVTLVGYTDYEHVNLQVVNP